jgi:hypothetical protein
MNSVLCIAARHLAFLQPDDTTYPMAAANHLSRALSRFRYELSNSLTSIHLDAFIATSVLPQYEVWTNTDFCPPSKNGRSSFDPMRDRIFALSRGLKQVFLKSVLAMGQPSILMRHAAYNLRDALIAAVMINRETLNTYQTLFSYRQPIHIGQLDLPLPYIRTADLAIAWDNLPKIAEAVGSVEFGYSLVVNECCLLLSFLSEAQQPPLKTGDEKPLLPDLVRYIFSSPIMCRRTFGTMVHESEPHVLLLLYHFYRAVTILFPEDTCWWAGNRARLSERVLKEWLTFEMAG